MKKSTLKKKTPKNKSVFRPLSTYSVTRGYRKAKNNPKKKVLVLTFNNFHYTYFQKKKGIVTLQIGDAFQKLRNTEYQNFRCGCGKKSHCSSVFKYYIHQGVEYLNIGRVLETHKLEREQECDEITIENFEHDVYGLTDDNLDINVNVGVSKDSVIQQNDDMDIRSDMDSIKIITIDPNEGFVKTKYQSCGIYLKALSNNYRIYQLNPPGNYVIPLLVSFGGVGCNKIYEINPLDEIPKGVDERERKELMLCGKSVAIVVCKVPYCENECVVDVKCHLFKRNVNVFDIKSKGYSYKSKNFMKKKEENVQTNSKNDQIFDLNEDDFGLNDKWDNFFDININNSNNDNFSFNDINDRDSAYDFMKNEFFMYFLSSLFRNEKSILKSKKAMESFIPNIKESP